MSSPWRRISDKLRSLRSRSHSKLDFRESYVRRVKDLRRDHDHDEAMSLAVGGQFDAIGFLELETLRHFGLQQNEYLIDVGCGSGRLALPLSDYLQGNYLGIDVVPDLVEHARQIVKRPDWRFQVAAGLTIPEDPGAADMVCFFSVFTHLLHEQSYGYMEEAKRVLKPGGKIVFSFLDFSIAGHWKMFENAINDIGVNARPLSMFMSKDAIRVWAQHLGLEVVKIEDATNKYVPLSKSVTTEAGQVIQSPASIGQSVCVLQK